jgi:hypothetical protein
MEDIGASRPTHGSPPNSRVKIFSAVRVARAWVVSVGFGPPMLLARTELSAM